MDVENKRAAGVFITLVSFVMGLLFYLYYRPEVLAINLDAGIELPIELLAAFPSFIFMPLISGISIITLKFLGFASYKNSVLSIAFWLALVLFFEGLQAADLGFLSRGTFDWLDIIAAFIGSVLSMIVFTHPLAMNESSAPIQSWQLTPVLLLGLGAILGSADEYCEGSNAHEMCLSEVILSWEDVRAEIQPDLSGAEVLKRSGKIYTLDHWLFVVEKYRGIHIFDTTDQLNPIRKVYLPIPGALDLTIKDGILYSSAFTDLVAIDLNILLQSEGLEIAYTRQEGLFLHPPTRQFYPDFFYSDYDNTPPQEAGVVIGYKTKSGKIILYGDDYDRATEETNLEKEDKKDEYEDEDDTLNVGCLLLLIWMC